MSEAPAISSVQNDECNFKSPGSELSVETITTRLEPEEVLFYSVPGDEREACLVYELTRESRVFNQGWHKQNAWDLPEEAPPFLGRNLTPEAYVAFLKPAISSRDGLTNMELLAHLHWLLFMGNFGALFGRSPFYDWQENSERIGDPPTTTPYFPSTPYQKLPKSRLTKRPLIQVVPPFLWPTGGRSTVTTSGGAFFSFFILFGDHTDKELAAEFEILAGKIRPEKFKIEERKPSGKAAPERQAAYWLRRLGACRLFARYANLQSVPQEFCDVWYLNPVEMRESCISLDGLLHERFEFLDEGEKPECLTECERKGRFKVKSGRPRKS